jgi:membrane-associated protein
MFGNIANFLGSFLSTYGLLAIFVVMLLKELGVPVPIPSDLIMITAGVQAASGAYNLLQLFVFLEVAILVGGSGQFLLARGAGRQFIYRVGRLVGLTRERLDRAMQLLQRRGALAVFLGLNVPGARAGIIPAAGLAGLAYPAFAPAMLGGSTVFYGWHIALGFIAGPSATSLLDQLHLPGWWVLVALAAIGLLGWLALRVARRRKADSAALSEEPILASWAEAACPACLAITAARQFRGANVQLADS